MSIKGGCVESTPPALVKGALTQYIASLKPYPTKAFHLELMEVRGADEKARRFFKATDSTNLGFPARRATRQRS